MRAPRSKPGKLALSNGRRLPSSLVDGLCQTRSQTGRQDPAELCACGAKSTECGARDELPSVSGCAVFYGQRRDHLGYIGGGQFADISPYAGCQGRALCVVWGRTSESRPSRHGSPQSSPLLLSLKRYKRRQVVEAWLECMTTMAEDTRLCLGQSGVDPASIEGPYGVDPVSIRD